MAIDPGIIGAAKEKAEALFTKGRYREALAAYEKIKAHGAKDPRVYLRMGDIARKAEDAPLAVGYYKDAIESFVKLGFLIKAIAVCKLIMGIDPAGKDVQERLAALYAMTGQKDVQGAGREDERLKLPRTPLFSDLVEAEFLEVVRKVASREVPKGSFVMKEGDGGDAILIVASGEVEVIGRAKGGAEIKLSVLKEGSIFGEFGFFLNSKRTADVKAIEDSTILELKKADLNEVIRKHPRVETVLFDFYKERIVDKLMALSEVFRPMGAADRKEILSRAGLTKFGKDALIMKEGDKGDTMYLIKSGRVSVWVNDRKGDLLPLTELSEGDFFGEIALATSRPRVANVTALTDTELVQFSRPMIKDILMKYPEVKGVLEQVIKERVVDLLKAKEGVLI